MYLTLKTCNSLQVGISHDLWAQSLSNKPKVSCLANMVDLTFFKDHVLFHPMGRVAAVEMEAPESRKPSSFR